MKCLLYTHVLMHSGTSFECYLTGGSRSLWMSPWLYLVPDPFPYLSLSMLPVHHGVRASFTTCFQHHNVLPQVPGVKQPSPEPSAIMSCKQTVLLLRQWGICAWLWKVTNRQLTEEDFCFLGPSGHSGPSECFIWKVPAVRAWCILIGSLFQC